jgi:hypothetical protein
MYRWHHEHVAVPQKNFAEIQTQYGYSGRVDGYESVAVVVIAPNDPGSADR